MIELDRRDQAKLEIYRELERLAEEMNSVIDVVIVEGQHDRKTLRALGYRMRIILSSGRLTYGQIVERSVGRFSRIAILTDFDEEGERMSLILKSLLERRGTKVDQFYRNRFRDMLRKAGLTTLESIFKLKRELFPT